MDSDTQTWRMLSEAGLPALLMAMAATAVLIGLLFPLMRRYALARPNVRSSHTVPTPQGGGIAVIIATLITLVGAASWTGGRALAGDPGFLAMIAATVVLAVLGLIDDIRPIAAGPRLVVQALAVALVITTLPGDLRTVPALPLFVERAVLALALLWFVNLVNFMDGIDWMSVAEMVPLTAGLAVLAALGALPPPGGLAALALCGAMLGFAPFNRPVARLFLGDVGSLPIGLMTGWLLVLLAGRGHLIAALLLPLYYLADATLTLLRRIVQGERPWEAHRTHFYQRARANGFSVGEVVGQVFLTNLALVALALLTVLRPGLLTDSVALAAGCLLVGLMLVRFSRNRRTGDRAGTTR